MPRFQCVALDSTGEETTQTIEAPNENTAIEILNRKRLTLVEIKAVGGLDSTDAGAGEVPSALDFLKARIPLQTILTFYEQLSFLLVAGIPLFLAVRMCLENSKDQNLIRVLRATLFQLSEGQKLSSILQKFPRYFPNVHCQLIHVGERTGNLESALQQLVSLIREKLEIQEKLMGAISYPLFLISMTGGLILTITFVVFPKFSEIFASFKVDLPPLTAFLINLSVNFRSNAVLVFGGLVGAIGALVYFFNSPQTSEMKERLLISVPVISEIFTSMFMAVFAKTVASLLRSGIPLLEAIVICSRSMPGGLKDKFFNSLIHSVREGETASSAMEKSHFVPELAWQLMAVGEKTGEVTAMLESVFAFYKKKGVDGITKLMAILKPAMMFMSAGIVMVMAMALFIPLFKLGSSIKRGH